MHPSSLKYQVSCTAYSSQGPDFLLLTILISEQACKFQDGRDDAEDDESDGVHAGKNRLTKMQ